MRYPNNIIKENSMCLKNYKNRGMSLESMLNDSNKYYLEYDIAVIYKKPTPIKVLETKYKTGNKQEITKAFYEEKSTTDYNGIYKGIYIDFEAKETNNISMFPISNIHRHQIKHMEKIINHGGISFVIIKFNRLDKIYLLPSKILINLIKDNKKHIKIDYFKEKGYLIENKIKPKLDYLKIVDKLI